MRLLNGLLALFLLAAPAFAGTQEVAQFCGQDDTDAGNIIPDCAAKSALNVEANLGSTAISQRQGFTQQAVLSVSTAPVTGSSYFKDSSGNDVIVVCNGTVCSSSKNGSAFQVFYTTASPAVTQYSFVSYNGVLYGADNAHDAIWTYDGTNFISTNTIPACSILALDQDRMLCANTIAAPNSVNYSQSGNYASWTPGVTSPAPFADFIGTTGDQITGISYWLGTLYIFKQYSITACVPGDQFTTSCVQLGAFVGTSDGNSIVQAPDGLYFKGTDGNFWKFDGYNFTPISLKIQNTIKSFASGSTGFNIQTGQQDWQLGTQNPTGSWNTVTIAGSVFPSSTTSTFSDAPTFASWQFTAVPSSYTIDQFAAQHTLDNDNPPWVRSGNSCQTASVSNSTVTMTVAGSPCVVAYTLNFSPNSSASHVFIFRAMDEQAGSSPQSEFKMLNQSNGQVYGRILFNTSGASYLGQTGLTLKTEAGVTNSFSTYTILTDSNSGVWYWRNGVFIASQAYSGLTSSTTFPANQLFLGQSVFTSGPYNLLLSLLNVSDNVIASTLAQNIPTSAVYTSPVVDTSYSTPVAGPFTSSATLPSTDTSVTYQLRTSTSPNNDLWGSYESVTPPARPNTINERYWQFKATLNQSNYVNVPVINSVSLQAATTGTFVTQCITPPSTISGWGILTCNTSTTGGGALTFYSTSAATCAGLATATQTTSGHWTTTTNGGNITVSTNTAFAIRFDSTLTSSTDTAQVNSCITNWKVGVNPPPVWGIFTPVNNAIYWSGDVGNSTNTNRTLKYDMNDQGWFPFDMPMQAPLVYKNNLYFGNGNAGLWDQYGLGVYSDNGVAINSYWISKDWNLGEAFQEKTVAAVSLVSVNQGSGSLYITQAADGGSSSTYAINIGTAATTSYIRSNYKIPFGGPFTFFNVEFAQSAANNPWSVLGYRMDYQLLPWRVLGPP